MATQRGKLIIVKAPASAALRAQLRNRIINRVAELNCEGFEAPEKLDLSHWQMSRLGAWEDVFTPDRLINAAANIWSTVCMTATRP